MCSMGGEGQRGSCVHRMGHSQKKLGMSPTQMSMLGLAETHNMMPLTRSLNLQININRDRRKMEGNITGSAVITFCESFTKCH
jgi:hypothetical protein